MQTTRKQGQALIELLLAISLASLLLPSFLTGLVTSREGKAQEGQRLEATLYVKELDEAVRSVREKGWSNIAANDTYYPQVISNLWSLTLGTNIQNDFTRQIVITDANRDASGNLVTSGGTPDPSTKKITSTVTWGTSPNNKVETVTYLTRHLANAAFSQDSQAEFSVGNNDTTVVENGDVKLENQFGFYFPAGEFTSHATGSFDAGKIVTLNNFTWSADVPTGTSLEFRIAASDTDPNPSTFLGPNANPVNFYTSSGPIFPNSPVTGRYFRYKVLLSTNNVSITPIIHSVNINYSP